MKILVIFTGGTIGSAQKNDTISLQSSTKYTLLENYKSSFPNDIMFEHISPYNVLSENLSAIEITKLVSTVCENVGKDYDGIIVTHGTDTIQYSASALHYALGVDTVPVVLVSSNYPLEDMRSNGHDNFASAVSFICSGMGRGVFVSYKNPGKDYADIHRGNNLLQHAECDDALYSANNMVFATIKNGKVIKNDTYQDDAPFAPVGAISFSCTSDILVVEPHPADNYSYELCNYRAVLLSPYHSSTLDTESKQFCAFCKKAMDMHIPVYLPHFRRDAMYESTKKFAPLGIMLMPDSTFVSAYIKLWIKNSIKS